MIWFGIASAKYFINNNWVFGIKSGLGSSLYYVESLWLLKYEFLNFLESEIISTLGKNPIYLY